VCTVHSVMSARRDSTLAAALKDSDIATPDGMPLVWALRWTAGEDPQRVYGPELMRKTLIEAEGFGLRHYLYGSSEETLTALATEVGRSAPAAQIVGTCSPPFRTLTADEDEADLKRIRDSGADVVWVGLGMPKQELWMARVKDRLPGVALVGVGAAFDFIAGTKKQAPAWMARSGLEWVYRLTQEPKRLWKRYIWNNPAYLALLLGDVIRGRLRSVG
ncbi:MAG: WecB/TagA/CpsF family glycosyltransferase, partial [Longimicrobiales bacterium]